MDFNKFKENMFLYGMYTYLDADRRKDYFWCGQANSINEYAKKARDQYYWYDDDENEHLDIGHNNVEPFIGMRGEIDELLKSGRLEYSGLQGLMNAYWNNPYGPRYVPTTLYRGEMLLADPGYSNYAVFSIKEKYKDAGEINVIITDQFGIDTSLQGFSVTKDAPLKYKMSFLSAASSNIGSYVFVIGIENNGAFDIIGKIIEPSELFDVSFIVDKQ